MLVEALNCWLAFGLVGETWRSCISGRTILTGDFREPFDVKLGLVFCIPDWVGLIGTFKKSNDALCLRLGAFSIIEQSAGRLEII